MLRWKRFTLIFAKYLASGCIGTAAQYAVLIGGSRLAGRPVLWSSLGAIIGAILNYFINYQFTFKSTRPHLHLAHKFFAVALLGVLINAIFMSACIYFFAMHYLLAQFISTGLVVLGGFLINLTWTFRELP